MDIRKYGKPPKKIISAEQVLGLVKKKIAKGKAKPSRKDKAKPKKDKKTKKKGKVKPKSILSKTLKRAPTTDQALYNSTQQQFLESLRGKLKNGDGRTNSLWNSYKSNLQAQSFGGSPYELHRLSEEATVLREKLERTTNNGRMRPTNFTTGTQTEAPPRTPLQQFTDPPRQSPRPLRPSMLGFGQEREGRPTKPVTKTYTGGSGTTGALQMWTPEKVPGTVSRASSTPELSADEKEEKADHDKTEARIKRLGGKEIPFITNKQMMDDVDKVLNDSDNESVSSVNSGFASISDGGDSSSDINYDDIPEAEKNKSYDRKIFLGCLL